MFRIIKDLGEAHLLMEAGVLWWVSKDDGADIAAFPTLPVGTFTHRSLLSYWTALGVLGIHLED